MESGEWAARGGCRKAPNKSRASGSCFFGDSDIIDCSYSGFEMSDQHLRLES